MTRRLDASNMNFSTRHRWYFENRSQKQEPTGPRDLYNKNAILKVGSFAKSVPPRTDELI